MLAVLCVEPVELLSLPSSDSSPSEAPREAVVVRAEPPGIVGPRTPLPSVLMLRVSADVLAVAFGLGNDFSNGCFCGLASAAECDEAALRGGSAMRAELVPAERSDPLAASSPAGVTARFGKASRGLDDEAVTRAAASEFGSFACIRSRLAACRLRPCNDPGTCVQPPCDHPTTTVTPHPPCNHPRPPIKHQSITHGNTVACAAARFSSSPFTSVRRRSTLLPVSA